MGGISKGWGRKIGLLSDRTFFVMLVIWLISIPYTVVFGEVILGGLRKGGRLEWANLISAFLEATGLAIIAIPVWHLSVAVTWLAPFVLLPLLFLKSIEIGLRLVRKFESAKQPGLVSSPTNPKKTGDVIPSEEM